MRIKLIGFKADKLTPPRQCRIVTKSLYALPVAARMTGLP
jgi:hypothetical protein